MLTTIEERFSIQPYKDDVGTFFIIGLIINERADPTKMIYLFDEKRNMIGEARIDIYGYFEMKEVDLQGNGERESLFYLQITGEDPEPIHIDLSDQS